MSLNSLTQEEIDRLRQRNVVTSTDEALVEQKKSEQPITNALSVLIKYIPTEIVTLYIATIAAIETLQMTSESVYWGFVIFTPLCHWLVFMGKCGEIRMKVLSTPALWPWWGMFASMVAFAVWSLAIPNAPYVGENAGAIAGLGALFISTLLSLIEPIVRDFVAA